MDLSKIQQIDRPHPKQLKLYMITAFIATVVSFGIGFLPVLLALAPTLIRYYTMRYRFDEKGVGVSWGYFFRHESYITYGKIQDIHLTRGLLERWLDLGRVDVQTASGSGGAELTFIGLSEFNEVRDFLYNRMGRGMLSDDQETAGAPGSPDETMDLLRSIRDEVVSLKTQLVSQSENREEGE
jgi:uncharacterized protein